MHLLSLRRRRFCGFSLCLQASLNKLMETLDQSEPYFVKCIRSNAEKVSSAFKLLMEQLFFSLFFQCANSLSPPGVSLFSSFHCVSMTAWCSDS